MGDGQRSSMVSDYWVILLVLLGDNSIDFTGSIMGDCLWVITPLMLSGVDTGDSLLVNGLEFLSETMASGAPVSGPLANGPHLCS